MYKPENDFVRSLNASIQGQPWRPVARPDAGRQVNIWRAVNEAPSPMPGHEPPEDTRSEEHAVT